MSISEAERKNADYHAGPHDSFPVNDDGEHLKAAWDLAGHAGSHADEIRRHLLAFARKHGLMNKLPKTAQAKKAKSDDVRDLLHIAWNHESMEGDTYQKARLAGWASDHGLAHLLPDEAHAVMHMHSVPHNHEGMENDDCGMHTHEVKKAFNPISKMGLIVKSWGEDDVHFEGWLSTPERDLEKDVTEPEAFMGSIEGYFLRRAPLSIEHEGKSLPVGHLQKAAILRDGKLIVSAVHPTDSADFEHFPSTGSGVWVRGVVNEEPGKSAIRKGNVGGMSFIANAPDPLPLPGGRFRYTKLDPWIESTIAAYPINPTAVIAVAKAFGLQPSQETPSMDLEQLLQQAAEEKARKDAEEKQQTAVKAVTFGDVADLFAQFEQKIAKAVETSVEEKVQKALPSQERGEGVGRKGTTQPETPLRETDPAQYLIQKAAKGEDFDHDDERLAAAITWAAIEYGLKA